MKKAPKKIKAAIGAYIASLLTGLGVMMHAEASKAQDFLSYTPEEFNQQVEICAYKPDATKESCSKWLKERAELYCGTSVSWGNCFAILIQHGPEISHLKSCVEAFRQQMFDFSRRAARDCKVNGNCGGPAAAGWMQNFQNSETMLACLENNKSLNSFAQIEQACFVQDYFKKHYGGV